MRDLLHRHRFWIGLAVSAAALYLALRGVSWVEVRRVLVSASYAWLVPAAAVVVAGQVVRAARWQVLFGQGPRPDLRASFAILSVGYMVSNLFPMRLGDPVRAWLVDTRTPVGGAKAFATVLVERAIDFLTVAALLAVWVPVPAAQLLRGEFGAGRWAEPANLRLVALGLVVVIYALWLTIAATGERSGRLVSRVANRLGLSDEMAYRVGDTVSGFAAGFAPLRRPRTALAAIAWSLAVWLIGALGYWLVLGAFHIDVPFAAAVFAMGATAFFAVLPSSPGYVGVFHYGIMVGLATYTRVSGQQVDEALTASFASYAIVLHGMTMLVLIALGILGLWMLGLSGSELRRRVRRDERV